MAEKKGGILVSLDFKKAFDTLEWQFIKKILELFNFGENYLSLIILTLWN